MDKENAATNVRRRPDVKLQEPGVKLPEVLI